MVQSDQSLDQQPHQDAGPRRRHRRAGQPVGPRQGYQIAKGEYVILSKEDFESVKLELTHTLDIEKIVPRESINLPSQASRRAGPGLPLDRFRPGGQPAI